MYPNPQDVLPLPPRPSVEQYRKRARELVRAHAAESAAVGSDGSSRAPGAFKDVTEWSRRWVEALWRVQPDAVPRSEGTTRDRTAADHERAAQQVATFARARLASGRGAISQAQFVLARAHGFPSWPRLLRHVEATAQEQSTRARFEQAADAVVRGNLAMLERLLAEDPTLVHARSDREHGATLLHYVSANGIENYRQRTPANIVSIATRLLDAGADVRATCEVYGGGAETLGLVITSAHPRAAGVQTALADLLIARGAQFGTGCVRDALANGCPEAAAHMATWCIARGIPLDLQELAGIGRSDLVEAHLRERPAVPDDIGAALTMASWYGQRDTIRAMVQCGAPVDATNDEGATALHVACYAGQPDLVHTLLALGADVHRTDARYHTTPMVWTLHAWLADRRTPVELYHRVVSVLLDAGARVQTDWLDDDRVRDESALHARLLRRAQAHPTQEP